MARGRSDRNDQLRQQRLAGEATFYGNSTKVARACDRFFMDRGIVIDGLRGLITREARSHLQGRKIRDDKTDLAARAIEQSWET